ncbi:hypothetical protein ACFL5Z_08570 [Planctomycetota bacterium]
MWRTERGDRTLEGAEAKLFAETLLSLLDWAVSRRLDYYESGVESFDSLTFGQRISALAVIGNGLLRKDTPLVRLTAVLEGTIAAVFEFLERSIYYEINSPESDTSWRELVVAARIETEPEEATKMDIPNPTCTDINTWKLEVESLSDRILFDTDYEDSKLYIDFPPEKSKELLDWMDIDDDYFTAIADDLTDEQAQETIRELQKLSRSIVKSSG